METYTVPVGTVQRAAEFLDDLRVLEANYETEIEIDSGELHFGINGHDFVAGPQSDTDYARPIGM